MSSSLALRVLFLLAATALSTPVASAQLVDISLRTRVCTAVGSTARLDIFLTSQGPGSAAFGAVDVVLAWNPSELELLGFDNSEAAYSWLLSGFFPDPDGINADLLDGDALFTALAQPTTAALAPLAPGMRVTSLTFRPLVSLPNGSPVSIVPSLGMFGRSRVLSFFVPGLEITGNLGAPGGAFTCPIGTTSCSPAVPNSSGMPGVISIVGSPSVQVNDLQLTASQLPLNAFGYFLASMHLGSGIHPPGSQGVLCLLPPIGRGVGGTVFFTGLTGAGTTTVDLGSMAQPTGPVAVLPGDTWHFQAWHRDANPTVTSNLTDAVSLTFQ